MKESSSLLILFPLEAYLPLTGTPTIEESYSLLMLSGQATCHYCHWDSSHGLNIQESSSLLMLISSYLPLL
jgi:hypothetical protein